MGILPKKSPTKELLKDMIRGTKKTIKDSSKFYGKKAIQGSSVIDKILGKISPKQKKGGMIDDINKPTAGEIKLIEILS